MTVRPGRRERANMTFIVPRRNIGPSYFSLLSLTSTYPNRYPCPLQDTTVTLPNTTHTATTALPTLSVALSKPWLVSTLLCLSRANDCGCPERSPSSSAGSTSPPPSRIPCTISPHHSLSPWKELQQVLSDRGTISLA